MNDGSKAGRFGRGFNSVSLRRLLQLAFLTIVIGIQLDRFSFHCFRKRIENS